MDYVSVSGSSVKVSVNDTLYELSEVKEVYDADYADAVALSGEWATAFGKLPGINNITAANASQYTDQLKALYGAYTGMSEYQRTFLSADLQNGIRAYAELYKGYGIDITGAASSAAGS